MAVFREIYAAGDGGLSFQFLLFRYDLKGSLMIHKSSKPYIYALSRAGEIISRGKIIPSCLINFYIMLAVHTSILRSEQKKSEASLLAPLAL